MGLPDYIRQLRTHVGHDLLWLPSVSAVVTNAEGALLLGKRADDGQWSLISGFVEPGEQPATAVVREVEEETGVRVAPERLTSVISHPHTYPNGDRCEYLNLGFRCRLLGGTARVNDDESEAVGWFPLDRLPDLDPQARLVLARALGPDTDVWYLPAGDDWRDWTATTPQGARSGSA
ncbi:NUDIX hydrolase [Micromonospora fluostatini]|uniref:NUDIX hydrolase n=1 Tax=Micromonospora sp. JCM 30529 TaxID=3421643 RepID=UPI003D172C65